METQRVAIYARCSTKDQHTENQLMQLQEYAKQRGWTIASEYVDKGVSGAKESRPSLDRLMDAARKRKIDKVLVWRFDRFGRSTKHLILALEEFNVLGVDFISYNDNIDTGTPAGRVMFTMISAFAEFERAIIQERINAGLSRARAHGKRLGRPRAEVKDEQLLELRRQGWNMRRIAEATGVSLGTVAGRLASCSKNPPEIGDFFPSSDSRVYAGSNII